jgi:NO-binding membrane sensor protein with MHYT domain
VTGNESLLISDESGEGMAEGGGCMAQVHHFEYGWVTPVFAYTISVLGSLLGLTSTARARTASPGRRAWLLVLAAWAIGGTGIWVMHFMAMLGFAVPGAPLRYDVPLTVASFLIAVLVVGVGLFIVGFGQPSVLKVVIGGVVTGVSVAFMHYTGMAAMRLPGQVEYDRTLVLASYAIAIVAATVALWFTLVVRGGLATITAAAVMGAAVCGMHYTGMAALRVHLQDDVHGTVPGVNVNVFLAPIVLFVVIVVIALSYVVMAIPSAEEQDQAASLRTTLTAAAGSRPAPAPPAPGAPRLASAVGRRAPRYR